MFVSRSKKGFTLAEVLITLLIIGVVASLVIPALIGDTQQAELKTALKKAVATANQALAMSIAQDATDATGFLAANAASNLMNIFAGKLNVISKDTANNMITTADGMTYQFFVRASQTNCDPASTTAVNADSIAVANCWVLVDVNGSKNPNVVSDSGAFKDRYYLVIRDRSVIPGRSTNAGGFDMAQQAMFK